KSEAAQRLLPVIGMISDRVKRDAYIRKLASTISIDERSLYAELQRVLRHQRAAGVTADFSGKSEAPNSTGEWRKGQQDHNRLHRSSAGEQSISRLQGNSGEESEEYKIDEDAKRNGSETSSQSRLELDRSRGSTLKWEDYLIGLLLQNPALSPY